MNDEDLTPLPSLDAYISAFKAIEASITDNQWTMLKFHHAAPARAVSPTTLGATVGYVDYRGANLHYGGLAAALCRELGLNHDYVKVGALVDFVWPNQGGNEDFLWIMRERVALALEELGWVPRVAGYLYPDLALRELQSQVAAEAH